MSDRDAIRVTGLTKSYGNLDAVRGVDLTIREGEVFALLGPNGAGKTTTVEILEGFRRATSGTVRVLGLDPASAGGQLRRQVGVVLQEVAVEPYLTVSEVLERNAGYYDDPLPVPDVVERVGLAEKANARIKTLSGGQQRRLDVALGIIGRPRLLFLDEPTTGFDPSARRGAWDLVRSLREVGTTIVLTTHYMDEAQALADRLAVIARGRIVAEGTVDAIGGRDTAATRIRFAVPTGVDLRALPVDAQRESAGYAVVRSQNPTRTLHLLTGWAIQRGLDLTGLTVDRPSLEDIYLELIKDPDEAVAATTAQEVYA
ncbi:MAG TPA: ABC transporter ATP-binding protein [Mycobacteriales bacterium]|nr:ABC transporter ATP-binding protein [Mycobacteriales bacterium]